FFAGLGLHSSRKHSRGCPARTAPRLGAVIHGNRAARLSQPPGNSQAHHSGADDDGFRAVRMNGDRRGNNGLPSPARARPGSVGLISADPAAQAMLRRRLAPQPSPISDQDLADARFFLSLAELHQVRSGRVPAEAGGLAKCKWTLEHFLTDVMLSS